MNSQTLIEEQNHQLDKFRKSNESTERQINEGLQLVNENLDAEIQQLRHLPFVLQRRKRELHESNQKFKIFEKTINCLTDDIEDSIVRYELLSKEQERLTKETNDYKTTRNSFDSKIKTLEKKNDELEKKNESLNELSEKNKILEELFQLKAKECLQLTQNLQAASDENTKNVRLQFFLYFNKKF